MYIAPPPARWPFVRHVVPAAPAATIEVRNLHLAFPAGQGAGTRLVLTQSTYHLQRWLDFLDAHPGVTLVLSGEVRALHAEAKGRRGPWSRIDIAAIHDAQHDDEAVADPLHAAFVQPDPRVRLDACRAALDAAPDDPALLLAFASSCMELQLLHDAAAALERAVAVAGDWEATHFELGKLCLRTEDTARAADAFAQASRLMPTFAAAWSNLGAALGELDRPDEALAALTRALQHDPHGYPVLNNMGALHREQGRLDEAIAAFRQVIALAPQFVFGHYNLGHSLLLAGSFDEARRAYEEGFSRDGQKNPRQACRLVVARTAAGDAGSAISLLETLCRELPRERIQEGLWEAESTLDALSAIPGIDAGAVARVRTALGGYSS
jgi:tetratricopeptide (TPR) repeat protein